MRRFLFGVLLVLTLAVMSFSVLADGGGTLPTSTVPPSSVGPK